MLGRIKGLLIKVRDKSRWCILENRLSMVKKCYKSVIHPSNGPDLWERTDYGDVMPPPYRRPSHRPAQQSKKPNKGKKKNSRTNSHPPAAKGGRKTTSSHSIAKIGVKRKTTSVTQPLSSTQSNSATQPKRPRDRPKGTTKPNCLAQEVPQPKKHPSPKSSAPFSSSTQPNTTSLLASQSILSTSSTQPPVQHKHTVRQTSRQPVGQFSIKNSRAPHVSP
ncbi:hypothetical protein Ahy_B08g090113 [Arachis hypogaea]|uniref:Uncharacterized protein n=1 Tax=Arachis hypogaea TaxID=3818 RepID=A0A444XZI1_ARAHY|nr:hypothetical protein Ahy_B08g090113 [Arachis hypogaea]